MALLWMEGFEGFDNSSALITRYNMNGINSLNITAGRNTTLTNNKAARITFSSQYIGERVSMGDANMVFGAAFKYESTIKTDDIARFLASTGAEQLVLRTTAAGEIAVDRSTTNLGITSGFGLLPDVWYYIEIVALLTDGATGTLELWVDGIKELDLSSVQTRNVSGENISEVRLEGFTSVWDDVYFLDGTGTDQTTRIDNPVIELITPDANGTTNNFTASPAVSNYLNVDDGNTPDDDTTYNHSSTATDKELYGMSALEGSIDTIIACKQSALIRKEGGGSRTVAMVARSSATEVDGPTEGISGGYSYRDHIYENDPNGGAAWTESSVNAAEFGIKIIA
jgi:hypothetical protein